MSAVSHVDLVFPARGGAVPRDHGYALYGAVSRLVPAIHGACWIAIHGLSGWRVADDLLMLGPVGTLGIRVPADRIGALLPLAGATLEVVGYRVELGAPTVHALVPVSALDAQLVVIRFTGGLPGRRTGELPDGLAELLDDAKLERRFMVEARRQLDVRGIRADLELRGRRSLRVCGQRLLGFAVRALGLSASDSLALQVGGLGGKRVMGCGIFRPAGGEVPLELAA